MPVIQLELVATHGNMSPWTMKGRETVRKHSGVEKTVYTASLDGNIQTSMLDNVRRPGIHHSFAKNIPVSFFGNEAVINSAQVHTLTWTVH